MKESTGMWGVAKKYGLFDRRRRKGSEEEREHEEAMRRYRDRTEFAHELGYGVGSTQRLEQEVARLGDGDDLICPHGRLRSEVRWAERCECCGNGAFDSPVEQEFAGVADVPRRCRACR